MSDSLDSKTERLAAFRFRCLEVALTYCKAQNSDKDPIALATKFENYCLSNSQESASFSAEAPLSTDDKPLQRLC